jgi:hypothetical protein
MKTAVLWIGRLAVLLGLLLCALALGLRLGGTYFLGNYPVGTLFNFGVAGMVLGCAAYLVLLAEYRS